MSSQQKDEKIIKDKYQILGKAGEGGFCVVFKARNMYNNEIVAIKRVEREKKVYKRFQTKEGQEMIRFLIVREIAVMKSLDHPNILKLIETINENGHIYMVLQFVKGGELYQKLLRKEYFGENVAGRITEQLCKAVAYMHEKGVVHRDIKAENVLLEGKSSHSKVILADFGLSRTLDDVMMTNCGTVVYSAPELLINNITKEGYTYKIDNWSIGVLTFFMLTGKLPFPKQKDNEALDIRQRIISGDITENMRWVLISENGKRFVNDLLTIEPKKRLELEDALNHPWLVNMRKPNPYDSLYIFPRMEVSYKKTLAIMRWRILFNLMYVVCLIDDEDDQIDEELENQLSSLDDFI